MAPRKPAVQIQFIAVAIAIIGGPDTGIEVGLVGVIDSSLHSGLIIGLGHATPDIVGCHTQVAGQFALTQGRPAASSRTLAS